MTIKIKRLDYKVQKIVRLDDGNVIVSTYDDTKIKIGKEKRYAHNVRLEKNILYFSSDLGFGVGRYEYEMKTGKIMFQLPENLYKGKVVKTKIRKVKT